VISAILVNWNSWADTIACIQSLLNSHSAPMRIIVVDNQSEDDSIYFFRCWANGKFELNPQGYEIEYLALDGAKHLRQIKFLRYIESKNSFDSIGNEEQLVEAETVIYVVDSARNGGFGFGCNVGMKLAKQLGTEVIWLLNNDCVVKPETLGKIRNNVLKYPKTIFGCILKYYYQPNQIQALGGGYMSHLTGCVKTYNTSSKPNKLNFINGASMAFAMECFDKIGGFDEQIFMYFEENDFCLRAASAGYCFEVIRSEVFHKHGGSQGCGSSATAWKNVLINKHYVLMKNFGFGTWTVFFYTMLILRCLFPFKGKNASIGARQALKILISKGAA
jgi:GT2 family glycosyltransferase